MTEKDLQRVQEIDAELLLMVDQICRRNNIQYFLFYGSLLGAVRHHGPIPWDDDVDICMTRENYQHFASVLDQEISDADYEVQIMGSGSTEYLSEIKIGKKNTLFCLPGSEKLGIMNRVQLDVFCLDYIRPMSLQRYRRLFNVWKFLRLCKLNKGEKQLLMLCIDRSNHRYKALYKIGLNLLHGLRFFIGEKNIERIGYRLFVDETKTSKIMAVAGSKELWKKDYFTNIILADYSGKLVPIPERASEILENQYGDYMKYPPEGKRLKNNFDVWVFKEF